MKRRLLLLLGTASLLVPAPGLVAQSSPLRAELLKDWTEQKGTMLKIADAMPAEKFSYKSTPAQRDYGQQILHVANANLLYLRFMGAKAAAPSINRDASGKADILKALADSYDYGMTVMNEQTDQSLLDKVDTNRFLGPSSRARIFYFLLGHTWDIYGQMAVYLRLNGITPPASQRP
jgi:hypothetical protein